MRKLLGEGQIPANRLIGPGKCLVGTIDECPPRGEVVQRPTEAAQEPRGSGPLPSTPARARGSSVRATPSLHPPRILKTISLFYRKEDSEKSRLRGRLQLFFFISRVGISNCRCGNSICRQPWVRSRRVIVKVAVEHRGINRRFIVTNWKRSELPITLWPTTPTEDRPRTPGQAL